MKKLALAATLTFGSAIPAAASCEYLGGYYGEGSVVCAAGGWLQQCTIAGYWAAIGHCKEQDMTPANGGGMEGTTDVFSFSGEFSPLKDTEDSSSNAAKN
ncbi:hypothetical protein ATO6_01930 [Oceanicola sp. 22II-s10i]|uniref:hypothetical protein n=1 Tax=Oceanicola sp. 22II-s10i TaxID=1317116 RepID=UPI000B51E963|nr:hypothetical protein [Oceanicola sp. 22II-s10i]OWU85708.1 hypothetical protein ATO6_01930 [Oceanicola sp. 22II-s10i]